MPASATVRTLDAPPLHLAYSKQAAADLDKGKSAWDRRFNQHCLGFFLCRKKKVFWPAWQVWTRSGFHPISTVAQYQDSLYTIIEASLTAVGIVKLDGPPIVS